MTRKLGWIALLGLVVSTSNASGQGFGFGGFANPGFGGGYGGFGNPGFGGLGFGYGGFGLPFASFPFPNGGFIGNGYTGPGSLNPLFGLGLSPLAVDSYLGEASLGRIGPKISSQAPPAIQSPTIVTVPVSGSRTYTYRIYRQ